MFIQQIYTNCLAHAAYYIESGKIAAVIDPLRDPEPYLELARKRGAKIKYVLETHFHADFVSGHIDLANKTGAVIVFGPNADPGYRVYTGADGEQLQLGDIKIEIVHTPGHTIESTCYLLYDNQGQKHAIFTGDTLFVGDVGRPDLLSGNLQKEELAGMLYESLQSKIKTLSDDIIVYPGHGAGSACGKNIGISSFSTIGEERRTNYALNAKNKWEFINAVTSDLPVIPQYFFTDASMNKNGASPFDRVIQESLCALGTEEFTRLHNEGATVLDTRDPMEFAAGFVPGSINIGLNGDFAVWTGTLIEPGTPLLLICDVGKEKEAVERLARIGYEAVKGYLEGGMKTWFKNNERYDKIMTFAGDECEQAIISGEYNILDVRNRRETASHRVTGAIHIPLNVLKGQIANLGKDQKWLIYCAGGYRSMVAASVMKAAGFHFVASLEGGINALKQTRPEIVDIGQETE